MSKFNRVPKYYEENEACFIFLDGGDFTIRSSSKVLSLGPQNALLSQCLNYFFELDDDDQDIDILEATGVMLYPSLISELLDFELLTNTTQHSLPMQTVNIDPLLNTFKDSITYLIENPSLADETLIEIKLREFIQLLMRQNQNISIQQFFSTLFNPIVYKIEHTIATNMESNLSIDELAFLTNMSTSTFKRRFKEVYQKPPHQYLLEKKIDKAKLLLCKSEFSISEIANKCGFDGISTFNRNFKKLTQLTPTQWIENCR